MKIFITDHHVLFREGLVSLLEKQPGIEVVGVAGSAGETLDKVKQLRPDIILLDAELPDIDGFEIVHSILQIYADAKVVILGINETDDQVVSALRCGAKGYILKNTSLSHLMASIHALQRGEIALTRAMTGRVLDRFVRLLGSNEKSLPELATLTSREMDVLRLLASGATNRMIAEQLFITENTVKVHIHNILDKLHVKNRREAAQLARKYHLAAPLSTSSSANEPGSQA